MRNQAEGTEEQDLWPLFTICGIEVMGSCKYHAIMPSTNAPCYLMHRKMHRKIHARVPRIVKFFFLIIFADTYGR